MLSMHVMDLENGLTLKQIVLPEILDLGLGISYFPGLSYFMCFQKIETESRSIGKTKVRKQKVDLFRSNAVKTDNANFLALTPVLLKGQ